METTEIEKHILLYALRRYAHDHVTIDLQKLIAYFDESYSITALGCNPKVIYKVVFNLWNRIIDDSGVLQNKFWEELYSTEKITCMSGTIEKMIAQIGKLDPNGYGFENLPEPNSEFLRIQK